MVLPDVLVAQLFGPVEGRRHGTSLLKYSKLHEKMNTLPPNRSQQNLLPPNRWNKDVRTVRISVKHGFKIITSLWAHLKYVTAQQIFTSLVATHFVVCTALANMHNCMYHNQVSQHFDVSPPSVEEYCAK